MKSLLILMLMTGIFGKLWLVAVFINIIISLIIGGCIYGAS